MSGKVDDIDEIKTGDYVSVSRAVGPYEKFIGMIGVATESKLNNQNFVMVRLFDTQSNVYFDRWCLEKCDVTECPGAVLSPLADNNPFFGICRELSDMYLKKNQDYGGSFYRSIEKYGLIAALTRMSDKFNRIENLILKKDKGYFESLEDSLKDLASYCIMTVMELKSPVDFENVE